MADEARTERVKVTVLLRPEVADALKRRAEENDRGVGYEGARIIAERIKADEIGGK